MESRCEDLRRISKSYIACRTLLITRKKVLPPSKLKSLKKAHKLKTQSLSRSLEKIDSTQHLLRLSLVLMVAK